MHKAEGYRLSQEMGLDTTEYDPPEPLTEGLRLIYEDFFELSTERQIGMAVGPIPESAITRHTSRWPWDAAWAFRHCIRAMDAVYLEKPDKKPADPLEGSDNPARDAFMAAFRKDIK